MKSLLKIVSIISLSVILLTSVEVVCATETLNVPSHKLELTEKLLLTSEEQAWLAKNHTIRVQYWQHPPYFYLKDGLVVGISVDLLNAVSVNTGLTFQFENRLELFSDVLKGLIAHQSPDAVAAIMPTPEREKVILFTDPYISSPRFIFTRNDTPFIASIDQLTNKKIAVVKDSVTHRTLIEMFPNNELLVLEDNKTALRAVSLGKAIAFVGDLVSTPAMINEFGLKNIKVVSPSGLPDHPLAMGIRNDWPELRSIMNKGLAAIPAAEKAAIINKWSSVRFDHGISPKDVIIWFMLVVIVVTGVILLFILWNKSLKKQVQERTNELTVEIHERIQAEKALTKSELKYRELVDSSLIGVFTNDLTGQFIFVNDAMVQMFDFDSTEQMEKTTTLTIWAELKDREKMLEMLKKRGRVDNFEAETITHTGRRIFVLFSARLNDGHISGMVMDITERQLAQQKIQLYQHRLKSLGVQLTLAEERERRRIAAELHDNIGQSLVFSRMQLASLRSRISNEKSIEVIDELSQTLLHIIQDTKELLFELSSPLLYEIGLSAAISHWISEQIVRKHGLETEFIDHSAKSLQNKEMSLILFRNIRELLINVVKHAHAKKVIVRFENVKDKLIIIVQDDGIGFSFDPEFKMLKPKTGFGLFSIYERMNDVGGSLKIESAMDKGCKAILTAPPNI